MTEPSDSPIEQRRRELRRSRDPRPERTRQAIVDAVLELGISQASRITVSDIVRTAGVARSSFYTHFASLDRLAAEVFIQAADQITVPDPRTIAPADRRAAWHQAQVNLIRHSRDTRALYATVLALPVSHEVHLAAVRITAKAIRTWIEHLPYVPSEVQARPVSTYIAAATIGLMSEWFHDETIGSEEQLLDTLMALTPHWLITDDVKQPSGS